MNPFTPAIRSAAGLLLALVAGIVLAGCASQRSPRAPVPAGAVATALRSTTPSSTPAPRRATGHVPTLAPATVTHTTLVSRCRGRLTDQSVVVSLAAQRMWLCHRSHKVRVFPITSGRTTPGTRTPTGRFRIQGRNRNSVLTLSSGRQYDVKFWIPFRAPDFGFHDASWQRIPFGSQAYRTHGSHGCVHMPLTAIRFFYNWVQMGTRVVITAR